MKQKKQLPDDGWKKRCRDEADQLDACVISFLVGLRMSKFQSPEFERIVDRAIRTVNSASSALYQVANRS